MIPLLVIGGITAALALLAKRAPVSAPANAQPAMHPIGSAVTPTPSTPPALFTTPEMESLYQTAVAARAETGIPIQVVPQPVATRRPAYVVLGSTAARLAPAPAPSRAPIAQVGGAGGYSGTGSRTKFALF